MSYNEDDWGTYDYDEGDNEDFFMSNDEEELAEEQILILQRAETSELQSHKNIKVELFDPKTLKSFLMEKVNNLKQEFSDFNLDIGDYWAYLRNNNFMINPAKNEINDNILSLMEEKTIKSGGNLDEMCPICYDEYSAHNLFDAGCSHKFCEECYIEHITEKIKAGPSCIDMKCPMQKCKYYVWDDVVSRILDINDENYSRYQKYL